MYFSTDFGGKVVQLTDALDRYDAVSNQVIALNALLSQQGFETLISSRFAHPEREHLVVKRDDLDLTERDVLIVHYYGYCEGLREWLSAQYCTKVMIYHNITPAHFFTQNRTALDFCSEGLKQLPEIIPLFHFLWGDSQFNVDDLVRLGGDRTKTAVVPIIVECSDVVQPQKDVVGHWAFVGRVAPNKGQVELVDLFQRVRKRHPGLARSLTLIGGADPNERYADQLKEAIARSGCADGIHLKGKIADEERDKILASSDFYVSLSQHEGFGVPLVEGPLRGLPMLALAEGAVAETTGGDGVYPDVKKLEKALVTLSQDREARLALLNKQQENAQRFSPNAVSVRLFEALRPIIPSKDHFKTVSVVICTYNRKDYLERCLEYLTFQSNDNFEVVVVDGPSNDGTDELLARHGDRIKAVRNAERNLSKSRNLGIDAAAGDIVAFIDDDALPFDDWVDRMLEEYNSRPLTTAGLGGPAYYAGTLWFQAEDNGISSDCQVKVSIQSSEIGRDGWYRYNTGTNATFSRVALAQVDGFDEQYDYFLDESELCLRLQKSGCLIGYSPEVIVRHEFAKSHNRSGKHNYNWFTICKNTAYFIATNSGLTGKNLESFVDKRMEEERIAPLDAAAAKGELPQADRDRHVEAIWKGVRQGFKDTAYWPRTRKVAARPNDFRQYPTRRDRLAVIRDCAPLHICIVSKEFPPFTGSGGVGTLYYHLASELLLMGHHVSAIVPSGEDRVHRQGRLSVYFTTQRQFSLPVNDNGFAGNMDWSLSTLAKLSAIHRERPIDIVDSSLWDAETLAFSLLDDRPPLVVRLVTPYAVSAAINGWNPSPAQQDYFMEGERTLIRRADAVIPISRVIASTVAKTHGVQQDGRWSIGHCGIAPWPFFDVNAGYDDFPELEALSSADQKGAKLVLFIGRLERRKGIDLILQAAPDILAENRDAALVIAGRDREDWATRFHEGVPRELHSRMIFLGEVSDATREKLFAHAQCVLFPSRYESFGLVPLEAFVHGCPVVATRAGAIPEVVQDQRSGILVPPDDPAAMAAAVRSILSDKKLRTKLSKGAHDRVKELSARNSALHTMGVYRRLLRRPAAAAAASR
jgi:glycosyltransferase involved in cell wall biosynthesis